MESRLTTVAKANFLHKEEPSIFRIVEILRRRLYFVISNTPALRHFDKITIFRISNYCAPSELFYTTVHFSTLFYTFINYSILL